MEGTHTQIQIHGQTYDALYAQIHLATNDREDTELPARQSIPVRQTGGRTNPSKAGDRKVYPNGVEIKTARQKVETV